MIKLTPDHVGTRVLLSDNKIDLLTHYACNFLDDGKTKHLIEWWHGGEVIYYESGRKVAPESDLPYLSHITLFLDAPNPLDVEVPEWCEEVMLWDGDTCIRYALAEVIRSKVFDGFFYDGWSPAPGQLPPKNNEDKE